MARDCTANLWVYASPILRIRADERQERRRLMSSFRRTSRPLVDRPTPYCRSCSKQRSTRRQTLSTFSNLPNSSAIKPTLTHIRVHRAAVRFPDRRVAQRVSRPVARGCCRATVRQQRPPRGRVTPLRLHRRRPPPVRIHAGFFEQGLEVAAVLHGVAICTVN